MTKTDRFRKKVNNFMFDHYKLKRVIHEGEGLFYALISAFIFAFGFVAFITPASSDFVKTLVDNGGSEDYFIKIVTGGVSGLSTNLSKILEICGVTLRPTDVEAIGYFGFNFPLIIFAFFAIGKRFSIFTAINVISTSLLIKLMPDWQIIKDLQQNVLVYENPMFRIITAGVCTGVSSGLAFKGEISCGGIDIVTYYYSLRKSTSVGKYGVIINTFIICLYSLLLTIQNHSELARPLISLLFSILYLFVVSLVVDAINIRNKKIQIQIITSNKQVAPSLIANFPHGATEIKAKGVYSGDDRLMIYMVVSSFEVKKVSALAKKIDQHAFISITPLTQVYGNFFINPIN